MIRNLRKKSDYDKAVITQNDLLRLAIANDANIAEARRAVQQGIPPTALPQTQKSPTELQADIGLQESTAIQNLSQLFKYTEVSTIIARLTTDEIFVLNQSFPTIKKDLEGKFDIKLLTPTFFIEYLKKYIEELNESKGVSTNLSNMTNKFNQLTTEIRDIQNYLPSNVLLIQLHRDLQTLGPLPTLQPIMDRIDALQLALPDATFFQNLEHMTDVNRVNILQTLQTVTTEIPTKRELEDLHQRIKDGRISRDDAFQRMEDLVNSVSDRELRALEQLKQQVSSSTTATLKPAGKAPPPPAQATPQGQIEFTQVITDPAYLPPNTDSLSIGRTYTKTGKLSAEVFIFIGEEREYFKLSKKLIDDTYENSEDFQAWCDAVFNKKPSIQLLKRYITSHGDIPVPPSPSSSTSSVISSLMSGTPRSTLTSATNTPRSVTSTTSTQRLPSIFNFFRGSRAASSTNPTTQPNASDTTSGFGIGRGIYNGARPKKVIKTGRGIDLNKEPLYKTFGKFIVSMPNLVDRDILQFKYPSLSRVPNLEPVTVSEDFKEFFLDCLENGKVNHKILKTLDEGEKKLFEKVVEKAGLMKGLGITKQPNKEDEEEVNRFNILRGEYYAGNNSHQLLDELRKLIIKFIHKGRINKNEGITILNNLC
jgi:polyhydroxyalkanoate synthesis regulator phasin